MLITLRLIFVVLALVSQVFVWSKLNFLQIDFAGHMLSGQWFRDGYFHQFVDNNFLGYVHGLFYPPLEDFILSILYKLIPLDPVWVFKIYLSVLSAGFFASIFMVQRIFISAKAKSLFLFFSILILCLWKPELVFFQGLSFVDMHITGLTSQILGGAFLFCFMGSFLKNPSSKMNLLWVVLCLLSHIVVSMAALLLMGIFVVLSRQHRARIVFYILACIGISAFYLFPFLAYKEFLTASNIFGINPWPLLVLLLLSTVLLWKVVDRYALAMFLGATAFVCPSVLGPYLAGWGLALPKFHYYRLAIFALYFLAIAIALAVDQKVWQKLRKNFRYALVLVSIVGVGYFVRNFSLFNFQSSDAFKATKVDFSKLGPTTTLDYERYWVIGADRSADFGLGSIIQTYQRDFRSIKGLYWESSRNNLHLSSYLATLLASPVVLDHFFYYGYNCDIQRCLLEHFFRDYNIGGIIVEQDVGLKFLTKERRACYQSLFEDGETQHYSFSKLGSIVVNEKSYVNYKVAPKEGALKSVKYLSHAPVETVNFENLLPFTRSREGYFSDLMRSIFGSCVAGSPSHAVFVPKLEHKRLKEKWIEIRKHHSVQSSLKEGALRKLAPGEFEIFVPGEEVSLVKLKLNFFPMLKLYDDKNNKVELFESFPGMLFFGKGKFVLKFEKSPIFFVSYFISIFSVLIVLIQIYRSKKLI